MRLTEPHSPWQNQAELMGGLIKRKVRLLMRNTNTPIRLWDYCWRYVASIQSLTASNDIQLDGRTPYEKVHGYTPNISEFIQNKWYDWIIFHEPDDPMKWNVGRWLGPGHSSGQGMAYNVLKSNGRVVVRSTIYPIEDLQMDDEAIKRKKDDYTTEMESHIGNYSKATVSNSSIKSEDPYQELFDFDDGLDDEHEPQELDDDNLPFRYPKIESDPPSANDDDEYVGMSLVLQNLGEMKEGTIKRRKLNPDGTLVGSKNANPMLDTREYIVEFVDENYANYSTNVLIENLSQQVDSNGYTKGIFKSITDHRMLVS